jgi:hypothetical protein
LETILPKGFAKIDCFATSISYEFPAEHGVLTKIFKTLEKEQQNQGILDWGVGQTTLEEVFIRLISEADASADY